MLEGHTTPPFKGFHGVTQGNPLSPIIFNLIMEPVMNQWVMVIEKEAIPEGLGWSIQRLLVYFYANNSLITLTQ